MTAPDPSLDRIEQSWRKVEHYVKAAKYRGHEPADGNASPLRHLTLGNTFLQRVLQQSVLRAPWNLRPLLRIAPVESPIARGYMASGYLALHSHTGEPRWRESAQACLDWLLENPSPHYRDLCWGNHFPYATRSGKLPRREPIIVWTSLIGQAFLDAAEILHEPRYLAAAKEICHWICNLPREETATGSCLSYHAFQQTSIHNANMWGAAMLVRADRAAPHPCAREIAAQAMLYSCSRQLQNGAWRYGEDANKQWIDNFHTGYNLEALHLYIRCTGDTQHEPQLEQGYSYFKNNFFDLSGRPRYYHDRTFPLDIQCAAQAIETFVTFSDRDDTALEWARKVAAWAISEMQASNGSFYHRDLGWMKVRTPLMHWGQATMFKALVRLWIELDSAGSNARSAAAPLAQR